MSGTSVGFIIFGVLLALLTLRIPIGIVMFMCGAGGYLYLTHGETLMLLNALKTLAYARLSNYDLVVIPLFLLMGQFATHGGLSRQLFHFVSAFLGHRRGGIAMASIGACAGFGAICGSSLATAATMGQVALPELRRYGYSGALATGALAAGGTLGIMIPPSVPLVIYAILTQESIGKGTSEQVTIARSDELICTSMAKNLRRIGRFCPEWLDPLGSFPLTGHTDPLGL